MKIIHKAIILIYVITAFGIAGSWDYEEHQNQTHNQQNLYEAIK